MTKGRYNAPRATICAHCGGQFDRYYNNVRYCSIECRLLSKTVVDESGCWLWTAAIDANGYGMLGVPDRTNRAHRLVYELRVGPIPEGLQLDHLCRVRRCVNPEHLEPVTSHENTRRSPLHRGNQDHCLNGHPYDEENTYRSPNGWRKCRTCQRTSRYRRRLERVGA